MAPKFFYGYIILSLCFINMVVMRGINDDEVPDFAALTLTRASTVRFIEYMPNLQEPGWRERCVPGAELLERIRAVRRRIRAAYQAVVSAETIAALPA